MTFLHIAVSLPRKSVVSLTDRPDMTIDVYRECKTTTQQQKINICIAAVVLVDNDENAKFLLHRKNFIVSIYYFKQ